MQNIFKISTGIKHNKICCNIFTKQIYLTDEISEDYAH